MKQIPRLVLPTLAALALATSLNAYNCSVFSFRGSNQVETIQGTLVLNLDAVRTTTATGYSFATPVDFLHYTVRDTSGVLTNFMLTVDNPNTLTITKGADGSTRFLLIVEQVPTDPPLLGPPAFLMDFLFAGEAPWGDSIPDRSVEGAMNVSLGASDLYDQSVSIVEMTVGELARQLAALNAEFRRLRKQNSK